jgi:hypothetical protein
MQSIERLWSSGPLAAATSVLRHVQSQVVWIGGGDRRGGIPARQGAWYRCPRYRRRCSGDVSSVSAQCQVAIEKRQQGTDECRTSSLTYLAVPISRETIACNRPLANPLLPPSGHIRAAYVTAHPACELEETSGFIVAVIDKTMHCCPPVMVQRALYFNRWVVLPNVPADGMANVCVGRNSGFSAKRHSRSRDDEYSR